MARSFSVSSRADALARPARRADGRFVPACGSRCWRWSRFRRGARSGAASLRRSSSPRRRRVRACVLDWPTRWLMSSSRFSKSSSASCIGLARSWSSSATRRSAMSACCAAHLGEIERAGAAGGVFDLLQARGERRAARCADRRWRRPRLAGGPRWIRATPASAFSMRWISAAARLSCSAAAMRVPISLSRRTTSSTSVSLTPRASNSTPARR